jgi:hypothetical protein
MLFGIPSQINRKLAFGLNHILLDAVADILSRL